MDAEFEQRFDTQIVELYSQTEGGFRFLAESRGKHGPLSHSLSASYTDGGDPTPGNRFKSPTFISNIGYTEDKLEIKSISRFSHIESANFPDDSGGPEFAVIRETEERDFNQFLSGLKFIHFTGERWANNLNLFLTYIEEDADSPGVAPGLRDPFGIPAIAVNSEYASDSLLFSLVAIISSFASSTSTLDKSSM